MAKITKTRTGVDPTKISGPYSLLAVMLLVAEILFAIWFYKSQSSIERTIAGSILALVFISLMILVFRMNGTTNKEKTQTVNQLFQEIAKEVTTMLTNLYSTNPLFKSIQYSFASSLIAFKADRAEVSMLETEGSTALTYMNLLSIRVEGSLLMGLNTG